jgi:hypothetical protein
MADNSFYTVPYKRSDNDKADIIKQRLNELKIAYRVMSRHPIVLNEFISAVKGGANLQATEPTAPEIVHKYRRDETH